jgi:hypothetical protein
MVDSSIGFVENDVNSVLLLSILAMTTTVLTFPLISVHSFRIRRMWPYANFLLFLRRS